MAVMVVMPLAAVLLTGGGGDFAGDDGLRELVGDAVGEFEDSVEFGGELLEIRGALDAEADAVGHRLDGLVGGVGDEGGERTRSPKRVSAVRNG